MNKTTSRSPRKPKTPVQGRSIDRVERVLDAAERLVAEHGTTGVTMQMISQESGVGRASVYQFFPSILAVWKGLAVRHLAALQAEFEHLVAARRFERWQDAWDALVDTAVSFYNENPTSRSILLGTDRGHDLRMADPEYDKRYAEWIAEAFADLAENAAMLDIDGLRVLVTANTAVFSLSVFEHGEITPFYAEQIKRLSRAYTDQLLQEDQS